MRPFDSEDEYEGGELEVIYRECTMTQDFGPAKKGEKYYQISIDYENGEMNFMKEDGDEETYINVRLVPV